MNKKIRKAAIPVIMAGILGLFSLPGCQNTSPPSASVQELTVVLDWFPNTNHTGIYVADANGYYAENGLKVKIVRPTSGSVPQLVASGQANFGISYQEEVSLARNSGVPVKAVAAIIQHNTSGMASPAYKNILSAKDFENRTYGAWGSPSENATIQYLMDKAGADYSKVNIVNMGEADFFSSMENNVDFSWIFYGWTGIESEIKAMPLNYIELRAVDPVFDYYTPVIISSDSFLNENPELTRKFLAATEKGYRFAIDHPDQAADILLKANPELDPELVKRSQAYLAPRYQNDAPRWGVMSRDRWEAYSKFLAEYGLISGNLNVDQCFSNEYLP